MQAFQAQFKVKNSFFQKLRKRPFVKAELHFNKTIKMVRSEYMEQVLDIIIDFLG